MINLYLGIAGGLILLSLFGYAYCKIRKSILLKLEAKNLKRNAENVKYVKKIRNKLAVNSDSTVRKGMRKYTRDK